MNDNDNIEWRLRHIEDGLKELRLNNNNLKAELTPIKLIENELNHMKTDIQRIDERSEEFMTIKMSVDNLSKGFSEHKDDHKEMAKYMRSRNWDVLKYVIGGGIGAGIAFLASKIFT